MSRRPESPAVIERATICAAAARRFPQIFPDILKRFTELGGDTWAMRVGARYATEIIAEIVEVFEAGRRGQVPDAAAGRALLRRRAKAARRALAAAEKLSNAAAALRAHEDAVDRFSRKPRLSNDDASIDHVVEIIRNRSTEWSSAARGRAGDLPLAGAADDLFRELVLHVMCMYTEATGRRPALSAGGPFIGFVADICDGRITPPSPKQLERYLKLSWRDYAELGWEPYPEI